MGENKKMTKEIKEALVEWVDDNEAKLMQAVKLRDANRLLGQKAKKAGRSIKDIAKEMHEEKKAYFFRDAAGACYILSKKLFGEETYDDITGCLSDETQNMINSRCGLPLKVIQDV